MNDRLLNQLQTSLGAQYSIQREIGRGALGIVFLAEDQLGRAVVVKVMGPDLLEAVGREAVLRELSIVTRLSHPHILPLLSCGDVHGMLYLVAPYVVGGSLAERIARQGQVPLLDALRIAHDVAGAVAYAHRHNVIHRDINPQNVLLDGDHVFVKDFWIARALATKYRPQLFSKGVVLGSLPYMSPEQASASGDVGPRSDVYSLACLLFEMLTGRAPLSGPWAAPTRSHSASDRPLLHTEGASTLPASLVTAITRALAVTPADRFDNPQDFVRACEEAVLLRSRLRRTGGLGLGRLLHKLGRISKQEQAHQVESPTLSKRTMQRLNDALQYRYEIKQKVGQGGMATVYLANDLRFSARKVALKVLRPEAASAVASERFIREIEVIARLTHPLILPLLDSGDADGMPFYVMPYLEGESLQETIHREGRLAVDRAIRVVLDVASALDYAHRHGVVHRDVKPDNILLYEGQAITTDFGIALALDTAKERLTTTGYSPGTPLYMSPEQFWDTDNIDHRSDIYSLGCVLYEMVVGQPPYSGNTVQAIAANHLSGVVPHARYVRTDLSEKMDHAICRALAKTPADRFPTVKDFAAALD